MSAPAVTFWKIDIPRAFCFRCVVIVEIHLTPIFVLMFTELDNLVMSTNKHKRVTFRLSLQQPKHGEARYVPFQHGKCIFTYWISKHILCHENAMEILQNAVIKQTTESAKPSHIPFCWPQTPKGENISRNAINVGSPHSLHNSRMEQQTPEVVERQPTISTRRPAVRVPRISTSHASVYHTLQRQRLCRSYYHTIHLQEVLL